MIHNLFWLCFAALAACISLPIISIIFSLYIGFVGAIVIFSGVYEIGKARNKKRLGQLLHRHSKDGSNKSHVCQETRRRGNS